MSLRTAAKTRLSVVRGYPADLALVSIAAVVGYYAVTTLPAGSVLRLLIAFPFAFFFPGYALVCGLFPGSERPTRPARSNASRPGGIDTVERLGLAFALSLGIVAATVLALPLTDWGLATGPAAGAFAAFTVGVAQLGAVRRVRLPTNERFVVSPLDEFVRIGGTGFESGDASASSIGLLLAVIVAGIVLTVAVAAPLSAAEYTELGLYAESEDGQYVAGDLPTAVEPGEPIPVVVAVENQEGEARNYTVVVQEQRLESGGGEVVDRTRLQRIDYRVDDGDVTYEELTVTPTVAEGPVRLAFLLYETDEGAIPDRPTNENADQDVYFWTTVTTGADDAAGDADADAPAGDDSSGEAEDDVADDSEEDDDDGFTFDLDDIFDDIFDDAFDDTFDDDDE